MTITEEQLQAKAWSILLWMKLNNDNDWVQQVGKVWLSKLWRKI